MTTTPIRPPKTRRRYDHRVRQAHCEGHPTIARSLGVPRSTAGTWKKRGCPDIVTMDDSDPELDDLPTLQARVRHLEDRIRRLLAFLRVLVALIRVRGAKLRGERLPTGSDKSRILKAIERAKAVLDLPRVLRALGLSLSRYYGWKTLNANTPCELDDRSSCPRSRPMRLTTLEFSAIQAMVTAVEFCHMSIASLALYAQRIGKVFVSTGTWYRLVRKHGWRRPKTRVYPSDFGPGIRATEPNGVWHIDTTVIKLLDRTKVYLQAIIDNFSRKILAWEIGLNNDPAMTNRILKVALTFIKKPADIVTQLFCDSGSENLNSQVDGLLAKHETIMERVIAQVDVEKSNSLIERFWQRIRHGWLYYHSLDSMAAVHRLVEFYVQQHNEVVPLECLNGLTPDEVFFGRGDGIVEKLKAQREEARAKRIQTNKEATCAVCPALVGQGVELTSS